MDNKKVKQMMVDIENNVHGMIGYKTYETKGFHGFDESGLFYCSGSNFMWVSFGTISLTGEQLKGEEKCQ